MKLGLKLQSNPFPFAQMDQYPAIQNAENLDWLIGILEIGIT